MIEFCNTLDAVVIESEADIIMQQIDLLFNTRPGEVLGMPWFGTNYSSYLHELNIGSSTIAARIKSDIYDNINLMGWTIDVDVKFMVGTQHDIMIIGVQFSKDTHVYDKVYKISEYQDSWNPDEYLV